MPLLTRKVVAIDQISSLDFDLELILGEPQHPQEALSRHRMLRLTPEFLMGENAQVQLFPRGPLRASPSTPECRSPASLEGGNLEWPL